MKSLAIIASFLSLCSAFVPISVARADFSAKLIPAVVSKNVDGDTIHVRMSTGQDETVRMLLIDTPEDVKPNTPVEPFSLQAAAFARKELPVGKRIYIEEGKPGYTRDKYGRLLAFVYITKTDMYNQDVVKQGLARVGYIYPPNTQHLSALEQYQADAKAHHLGIWSIPGYVTNTGYNMAAVHAKVTTVAKQPSKTANVSQLHVVSSRLVVSDGGVASVTIQTKPGISGTVEVDYKSGPSHASGLSPKVADGNGNITWTWEVGTRTTKGTWPVVISSGGKTIQLALHVK